MDTPSRRPGYSPLGRKTCFLVRWTEWQGRNEYGWDGFYPELVIWENLFFADNRLRLFMHETKQIVGAAYSFSSHSAPFPSTEWLGSGPCASCGSSFPVGIGDSELDVLEEEPDLLGILAENTCRQSEICIVRFLQGLIQCLVFLQHDEW